MTVPSLLPPNATPLERGLEQATAEIGDLPVRLRDLWNPATCPLPLLPYLAWALSIDSWSSDWPEAVKRARVAAAIAIQRRKGTAQSVRDVVASFGGSLALREWWQLDPPGDPHTFTVVVNLNDAHGAPATAAFAQAVIDEVARTKPARSHFTYTQALNAAGGLAPVAAARPAVFARLPLAA